MSIELDSTSEEVERALASAAAARLPFGALSPSQRQGMLHAAADALTDAAGELIAIAIEETNLTEPRLRGEVARTAFQLRAYADAAVGAVRAEIDLADADATPAPRPDLRLTSRPIGVVLNFAASNFPFAFSVAGTDTASALAAGCPVIVKAHSGHPLLSRATFKVLDRALRAAGAPDGTVGIVFGREAGVTALRDDRVSAAAFTGSTSGGRALFDIANARPRPIPFYGELGSLNPVVVAPSAAAARSDEILAGFTASVTGSSGQLCTKPGVLFWPSQVPFAERLSELLGASAVHPLLTPGLQRGYQASVDAVLTAGAELVHGDPSAATVEASALRTTASAIAAAPSALLEECFGPASLVVTYDDESDLLAALHAMEGNLTAAVFADAGDHDLVRAVLPVLEDNAGRILWGQWPTGVSVTRAQFHGGPYPATTNPLHTSVGTHAIDRFLRPITYQNFPEEFLPAAVR
ncbi:aldehyde dehydrogenase family protein [Microbacterium sp. H1-D42]|uniref:aldehyde dehydrogenase family protein n=1 Tax=Microbacterium sp. H1-D42 TaxID=2925844 RepID=UPI001F532F20|nr:aldehyde dehydrogenase family protein [Microbacterium sp. H1-D42]UNK70472.1 aldehyde dehydrogenase family protein [Microbacterium sp. H1-D42]